jgi:hypothetical protein
MSSFITFFTYQEPTLQFTTQQTAFRVFRIKMIFPSFKNALSYYNVGLAPGYAILKQGMKPAQSYIHTYV